MNNVTVKEALKKGRIRLVYLPMLMTFGIIGLGIYLGVENIFGGWIFPVAFIVGFSSGWLSWSYFVVEWKIWAYENVRNINELQRKAVKEKLICDSESWFEKTQFKNYQQKQKLKNRGRKRRRNCSNNCIPDKERFHFESRIHSMREKLASRLAFPPPPRSQRLLPGSPAFLRDLQPLGERQKSTFLPREPTTFYPSGFQDFTNLAPQEQTPSLCTGVSGITFGLIHQSTSLEWFSRRFFKTLST